MRKSTKKNLGILCFTLILLWGCASAESTTVPTLKDVRTTLDANVVAYPQLEGMADEAIQQAVNDEIVLKSDVAKYLVSLGMLQKGGLGLVVDYQTFLKNDILSITINAKGKMLNGREGHAYTGMNFDLQTGKPLTVDDLFVNWTSASADLEDVLTATLSEELSGYMTHSALTPIPGNNFAMDADGLTFYYPMGQFFLLSGYCGAGQFTYDELDKYLNWEGVLSRLDVKPMALSDANAKEAIIQMVSLGRLPHIPVAIGDKMTDVVAKYRLLREPDQYPAGKYYQLEAPIFRQTLVLSDALTSGYEHSVVEGLQSTRVNLFGIQAGSTQRDRWQEILGKPEQTATFSEGLAYDYGITPGESDFYTIGVYQLRLHADENGILHSVRLTQ